MNANQPRSVPLVCSGHQRPVVHLHVSICALDSRGRGGGRWWRRGERRGRRARVRNEEVMKGERRTSSLYWRGAYTRLLSSLLLLLLSLVDSLSLSQLDTLLLSLPKDSKLTSRPLLLLSFSSLSSSLPSSKPMKPTCSSQAAKMVNPCSGTGQEIGLGLSWVSRAAQRPRERNDPKLKDLR